MRTLSIRVKSRQQKTFRFQKPPKWQWRIGKSEAYIYILRDHSLLDLSTLENRSDYKFRIQLEHLSPDTDPQEYLATHYVDALFSLGGIPGEFYPKGGPVKIESSTSIKKDVTIGGHAY